MNPNVNSQHVAHIHIDKRLYESPTPTTGAALYVLAHVPAVLQLFKEEHEHNDDSPIANDGTTVVLKNGDHFRTGKPEPAGTTIYVNTDPVVWDRPQISYDELVKLAFPNGPFDDNVRYSITWTKPDGSEGAMLKGGKVKVVDGMKFDVRNTDKS
ncbi:MAG: multiubiquitin domain-containing protein [Gammaproteobacteria bacterium]|nr:multiubiquitin domain-containing protein [Gammaproteobacteria bacterium]